MLDGSIFRSSVPLPNLNPRPLRKIEMPEINATRLPAYGAWFRPCSVVGDDFNPTLTRGER